MNIEKLVLKDDLELYKKLLSHALNCVNKIHAYTLRCDFIQSDITLREYQRTINDLKHLQFKKLENERVVEND